MFARNALNDLRRWKDSTARKPLVLRGPRQVGKTTLVNEFAKEFDNYIYLNLEKADELRLLELDIPLSDKVTALFARKGLVRKPGTALIFIDEIQNSPRTMALLRYFYEELPEIHVIAAGSLLENVVDVKVSFPVGRVSFLAVRPCSFTEFLGALGKDNLLTFVRTPELSTTMHDELMMLFNQYVVVGGMPEAVARFAENRDIIAIEDIYESLLTTYRDDVEKYVRGEKLTEVVRAVLSVGWNFAGEAITMGNFAETGYPAREVKEAFRLLSRAMLLELVFPTSSSTLPATPALTRQPKLIWLDTGLVNYQAGVRRQVIGANDVLDVWRGRIAEQVVAQELLALDSRVSGQRAFWSKPRSEAEVDFVYAHNGVLYPLEVKNGHNAKLRSLHTFVGESAVRAAVRVWSQPFSVDEVVTPSGQAFRLINLPFYMLNALPSLLDAYAV